MGYRSEVKAVFYTASREQYPALKLYMEANFPKQWELEAMESNHYYGYIFSAGDVKWYDGYPDVIAFNEFVAAYTELINGGAEGVELIPWAYEFVRIGEDSNDVECTTEGEDPAYVLSVSREIQLDI